VESECRLLPLAIALLRAPLPSGWSEATLKEQSTLKERAARKGEATLKREATFKGEVFFKEEETGATTRAHPMLPVFQRWDMYI